ncbi:MAG: HDIG domain-containing metalloprotein [Gemmatimonadota bacterium]
MRKAGLAPLREAAAARTTAERVRYHGARWGLLLIVAAVVRLCFPPPAVDLELAGLSPWLLGPLLYDSILLSIFWFLLIYYRRETWDQFREMIFFSGLFILVIALSGLLQHLFPLRPELIPLPFATVLITVLYNGRLSVFAAVTLALVIGLQWELRDGSALLFALAGGLAGALGVRAVRHRRQVFTTILTVAVAMALASLALGLRLGWSGDSIGLSAIAGSVLALGSVSVALALLPVAESITGRTTDLTLLELSDPGQPLLRRLAAEAPGTWAHSQAVASLSEAAADAIGADGLLARVGCYYHDIGKLLHPEWFVENQAGGVNPHERLAPEESVRMIREHVDAGLRLARDTHLPLALQTFIAEHHGTSRLEHFYQARANGATGDQQFRYGGPRPSTAETAVVMLADAAEAATRALETPDPGKLREAIDRVISQRVNNGELRDAPLTLRDLDQIGATFARLLAGMHHGRLRYPEPANSLTGAVGG